MKMTPPSSSSPLEDTRVSPPDAPLSSSSRISVADMYPILVTHGNTAQPPVVFQDAVHKRAPFSALPNTRAGAIDDATTKPDSNESCHKARPTKSRSLLTASLAVARHRASRSSSFVEVGYILRRSQRMISTHLRFFPCSLCRPAPNMVIWYRISDMYAYYAYGILMHFSGCVARPDT